MAHYARISNRTVIEMHVLNNDVITDANGIEQETLGQQFLANLWGGESTDYIQCSYSGSFRGAYPGRGWTFDEQADAFVAPVVSDDPAV